MPFIGKPYLPLAHSGQVIMFETIFASPYGYLWEGNWPTPLEALARAHRAHGEATNRWCRRRGASFEPDTGEHHEAPS